MSMKPKAKSSKSTEGKKANAGRTVSATLPRSKNPPRATQKKHSEITRSSADRAGNAYVSMPGILNQMLDGLWVVNRKDCRILNVNDAMCRMLGYSREEVLQLVVPDIEARLSPKEVRERIVQLVRDGSLRFTSRQRRKDGMVIDVDVSAVYLPEEDVIFAFHRDITEQIRAEQALRESEARYRLISDNAADVIWVMEPMTGRFKYVSPSVEKLRGYTPQDVLSQPASHALTPDSLKLVSELIMERLPLFIARGSGTESYVDQVDQPHRDGSIVHTEVTTTYVFSENGGVEIVGVSRDITPRKLAEEALRKSEERFHLAVEVTQDGIWDWDIVTGQVYYSPVYFEMLGYEARKFPEHLNSWADLIHSEDRDHTLAINTDCIEDRCERFEVEFRMLAQDGTWKWILGKGKAVTRDVHGRALRLIGTHTDITERKRVAEALRQSEEKLRTLFNTMVEGMALNELIFDANGDAVDYRILEVNPAFEKISYLSREQAIGKTATEIYHMNSEDIKSFWKMHQHVEHAITTDMYISEVKKWRHSSTSKITDDRFVTLFFDNTEQKTAELALRESEQKYRLLFDNAADAILIHDEKGRMLAVNSLAVERFGYVREELMSMTVEQLDAPEYRKLVPERIERLMQHGHATFETVHQCQDGSLIPTEISARQTNWDGVPAIMSICRDITERKQVEAALAKSSERFELAQESAGVGVWDWNVVTGQIEWTSKMFELLGLDVERDPASFETWRRTLHPEDRETAEARITQALNDHVTLVNEFRIVMPNGQVRWTSAIGQGIYDQEGNALRMIGICIDSTEGKRAEEALRESEERFRTLYETMAQGVIYYNANGDVISANPAVEQILGLSLGQLKGDVSLDPRWHTIYEDGSDFPLNEHPNWVALRTGQPVQNVVMGAYLPQAGNYVWVNVSAVPRFRPGDEKPYQVYVMFDDISARKRNSDIMNARLRLLDFASTHTVKELLQAVIDEAGALVFSPIGFYHFVDSDQDNLTLQAWSTRTRNEFCTASGEDSHYPLMVAGVWADGARERRAIIHNDYRSMPNKRGMPEGHAALTRELVVPVMRGDRIVAVMGVGNKLEDYNATDLEIVTALADFSWDIIQQRKTNDELRTSEEQYRRLINLLPNGVVIHSAGKIELVNRAGNRFFGAERSEQLIGTHLMDRVDPAYRQAVRERERKSVEDGMEAEPIEEKLLRLDGTQFDAEVAAIPVNYAGKTSIMAVFNDITERKKRERELHAIAALSSALRTAPTRTEMLPVIVEQIVQLLNCDSATIEIIEPQTGDVIVEAAHGTWESLNGSRQAKGEGINELMSRTLQPFHTDNLEKDPSPFFNKWARKGIKGCLAVPLVAQEQLIGFIWTGRKTNIGENEVELLSAVADIAANAIHRATLHELTQKDAAELTLAYDTTLEGWASTLAIRDQETEGHTRRVVEMTLKLARLMHVGETDLENIRRGALLHDIGKMGIPDDVLHKAGTLNEREWEIMRRHPEYAYHLLRRIQYLQPALDIPYCHHEKWDGTGYPRGLKGEDIPLPARIFAVVDVWDALTNDRPYRLAWSPEKVLPYICEQSGKHFDPGVVDAFLNLIDGDHSSQTNP